MTKTKKIDTNAISQPTDTQFFITEFRFNINSEYFDLCISNYGLRSQHMKKVKKLASPLRWIKIKDCTIYGGHGSGQAKINNLDYVLDYAWRGLSESDVGLGRKRYRQVLAWTSRFKLPKNATERDIVKELQTLQHQICIDEGADPEKIGKDYYLPRAKWLLKNHKVKDNSLDGYRRKLQLDAKTFKDNVKKGVFDSWDPKFLKRIKRLHTPKSIEKQVTAIKGKRKILVPWSRICQAFNWPIPVTIPAWKAKSA